MSININFLPDLLLNNDSRFDNDILDFHDKTLEEVVARMTRMNLFSSKLDGFRYTSFWVLPNGKLYPVKEGCHEHTAIYFIADSGYTFEEDSLSEYAIRYSEWLGLRLPKKVTSRQVDTISDLANHPKYKEMMKAILSAN